MKKTNIYKGQVPIRDMSNLFNRILGAAISPTTVMFAKQIGDNNNVNRTDC